MNQPTPLKLLPLHLDSPPNIDTNPRWYTFENHNIAHPCDRHWQFIQSFIHSARSETRSFTLSESVSPFISIPACFYDFNPELQPIGQPSSFNAELDNLVVSTPSWTYPRVSTTSENSQSQGHTSINRRWHQPNMQLPKPLTAEHIISHN